MLCNVMYINRNVLSSRIHSSRCYGSQRIEGALESIVDCIPWRQKIEIGQNSYLILNASLRLYLLEGMRLELSVPRSIGQ